MKYFHRVTVAAVMVLSVLFVADVADAAIPSAQKVCVNKSTGVMRYVLKRGKQNCKKFEVRLIWNQTGATGATGASGSGAITQLSVCDGTDADTTANELCKIGMTGPGGGHVFFVDYNDQYASFCATGDCNYLEAAPADATSGAWCSDISTDLGLAGWDKSAVGAGRTNTATADTTCTSGAVQTAVDYIAPSFNGVAKDDWWLGSIGEMMLMYTNLRQAGVGGFSAGSYWSSSESDYRHAWDQNFSYGNQSYSNKISTLYVRPVRAF